MRTHFTNGKLKTLEYGLKWLRAPFFRALKKNEKPFFSCPICKYVGPFMDKRDRIDCKCPRCGELERTRLHFLLLKRLFTPSQLNVLSVLHVAPENSLRKYLKRHARHYISGDLHRRDVDRRFDIQDMPFEPESFDLVFASHVLQYPEDDVTALEEIKRILTGDGVAILPLPIFHQKTVDHHVRAENKMMHEPGEDYFDRIRTVFPSVEVFGPQDFEAKHQLDILLNDPEIPQARKDFLRTSLNLAPVCWIENAKQRCR